MNVAELDRLAGGSAPDGMDCEEAITYLARRVIAAEKLVEAGRAMADAAEHGNVSSILVTEWDNADRAYEETK